jgi:hypothetical protein
MAIKAIIFREWTIFKTHFADFGFSLLSNLVFVIFLFKVFGNIDLFNNLSRDHFHLIFFVTSIFQINFACFISRNCDKQEKIFTYSFLFFTQRLFLILFRTCFVSLIIVINLFITAICSGFFFTLPLVLCAFLLSMNYVSFSILNDERGLMSNFFQIFLIPLNIPIFFLARGDVSLLFAISACAFVIVNWVVISFCYSNG